MNKKTLAQIDKQIADLIVRERRRQRDGMELIPSENIVSPAVREAMGSILTNKYSEGYPHRRYYGGQEYIDQIEDIARERAKKLFGVPHVNVQPYSGSPANFAALTAVCRPGETIMGQALPDGGHLTHGWKASATGVYFNAVQYHVDADGKIDMEEVARLAKKHKPRVIWVGATAYPFRLPFARFAKIADEAGAYLIADIAHIAGLIVGGAHPSPVRYAHIVTTTTHKTLRGPRGGMIMVTRRGLKKDPQLAQKIDRAVFPMLQGGPHDHQTAAIAVALKEASGKDFARYAHKVVDNAKLLAEELKKRGLKLVGGGTQNHLMLIDCGAGKGTLMEIALDAAGITVNKNTVPAEPSSPFYPSGIRLGTPSITTRGMGAREMRRIAGWIAEVYEIVAPLELPADKDGRDRFIARFRRDIVADKKLRRIAKEVKALCRRFPVF